MNKKSLETRNKMKAQKPKFERQDSNIFRQFRGIWRRPRGIHSKLRRGFKGHKMVPSIGFSSPNDVKGLTRKGLIPFNVSNLKDLEKATNDNAVIISRTVGAKKRVHLLEEIKKRKLHILGMKDLDASINKINDNFNMKKKKSITRKEGKKKKLEEVVNKTDKTKTEDKKDESKK